MEGEDQSRNVTSFGSSRFPAGTLQLVIEHLPESHAMDLKSDVFDHAGKMLRTFALEGYGALIIPKYLSARLRRRFGKDVVIEL